MSNASADGLNSSDNKTMLRSRSTASTNDGGNSKSDAFADDARQSRNSGIVVLRPMETLTTRSPTHQIIVRLLGASSDASPASASDIAYVSPLPALEVLFVLKLLPMLSRLFLRHAASRCQALPLVLPAVLTEAPALATLLGAVGTGDAGAAGAELKLLL